MKSDNCVIEKACNDIKDFHLALAGITFLGTEESPVKNTTSKIMEDLVPGSSIVNLIEKNNWDELFKDKKWLMYLQGAQNLSVLNNDLTTPLKILSANFPKETKLHIIPDLLR